MKKKARGTEGRQAVWECYCTLLCVVTRIKKYLLAKLSPGDAEGSYCGESGTTLDVHQNVLSKFVKIHVTRC